MNQVELARELRVTVATIHKWRRVGLLAARGGGSRGRDLEFSEDSIERGRYIMGLTKQGRSLADCVKILGREKLGSFMERADCESWLNRWIAQYILDDPKASAEMKSKYPLAEEMASVDKQRQ